MCREGAAAAEARVQLATGSLLSARALMQVLSLGVVGRAGVRERVLGQRPDWAQAAMVDGVREQHL